MQFVMVLFRGSSPIDNDIDAPYLQRFTAFNVFNTYLLTWMTSPCGGCVERKTTTVSPVRSCR